MGGLPSYADGTRLIRQTVSPQAIDSSTSPPGITVLALHPLPAVPPHTLGLAVLSSPDGLLLSHINLLPASDDSVDSSTWAALVGDSVKMRDDLEISQITLTISQGTARGELGLVGFAIPESGVVMEISPRLEATGRCTRIVGISLNRPVSELTAEDRNKLHGKDSALSILLAMKQGVDWSDVVRATFAAVAKAEQSGKRHYVTAFAL